MDRAADGLVTSTKLLEVAAELTPSADAPAQLCVQRVELVVEKTHHQKAHCLGEHPRPGELNLQQNHDNSNGVNVISRQSVGDACQSHM